MAAIQCSLTSAPAACRVARATRPSVAGLRSPLALRPAVAVSRPSIATKAAADEYIADDEGFTLAKLSLGSILAPTGISLLVFGFCSFFTIIPFGGDFSSLALIYGFIAALLGFALKYAELEPVPLKTTPAALAKRETQMTDIQKQVRDDCTRFRYGDEEHLEEALQRVFKYNRPGGISRRERPILIGLREELVEDSYTLIMEFDCKLTEERWNEFQPKIETFFGPGITATIAKTDKGADVSLITDGSGLGMTGEERPDVLPPLTPNSKPRQQ